MRPAPAVPRVLMVHDYPPMTGGGLALAVRELAALVPDAFEVIICSSRTVDHFADDRDEPGARAASPRWSTLVRYDCIVVHWTFSFRWLSTLAVALAPVVGRPVLCVIHTAPDHCEYNRLSAWPVRLRRGALGVVARLMSRCDEVIALSPSHAEALLQAGLPVTRVLPIPVDTARRYVGGVERMPWSRHVAIGVVGELSVLKGSDDLPPIVRALVPAHKVVVAGRGPYSHALLSFVATLEPAARAAVVLVDRVPPERMPELYRELDCLLLCSRTESQSRVALEAMLAGVIVLGRPTTGVVDVLVDGRTGFCIDPDDPGSVRTLLDRLLDEPDLVAAVRDSARSHAAQLTGRAERDWAELLVSTTTRPAPLRTRRGLHLRRGRVN